MTTRAKAIQLSMEYDPQPPFDSGHMSKASAKTKATATALMGRELDEAGQLKATTLLLWDQALRARSRSRQESIQGPCGMTCVPSPAAHRRWRDARSLGVGRVGRVNLAYDDRGTGEPVLFIAGRGGAGRTWHLHQVPAFLRAGYRVITFDNRGVGATENAEGFTTEHDGRRHRGADREA